MPTIEEYSTDPSKALGLRPIINATCHHTRVGGTLIRDEVLDAMRAAAARHVDMNRLQKAAGEIIARHTHAEAGLVVSGDFALREIQENLGMTIWWAARGADHGAWGC